MKINELLDLTEEPNQYKFKKHGLDKFSTTVEVRGKPYFIEVVRNGKKWIATNKETTAMAVGDSKRFAVYNILKDIRKYSTL